MILRPAPTRAAERVVNVASHVAQKQHRGTVTAADIVCAALFDGDVARRIVLERGSLDDMRSRLLAHLAELREDENTPATIGPDAHALVARARRRAREHRRFRVTPADLVAAHVGAESFAGRLLAESNVTFDAERLGAMPAPDEPIGYRRTHATPIRHVVLWDDDRTTMAHVVDVLATCFAKCDVEAAMVMLTVHDEGAATIGTYPLTEATDRVTRASAFSRERDVPLRITIEHADFRPPSRSFWSRLWTDAARVRRTPSRTSG